MKRSLAVLLALAALSSPAAAQQVRSLAMGGVVAPGGAARINPAYEALPAEGTSLTLPLGLLGAVVSDRFDYDRPDFDPLSALDQASHLGSFLFNPARSPDELTVTVREVDGEPRVFVRRHGGADLLIARDSRIRYRHSLDLPASFRTGQVRLGIRPYLRVGGNFFPDSGFRDLFGPGSSSAGVTFATFGEVGISLEVAWAAAVPLPADSDYPGEVFFGVRAAPFLGLSRLEISGAGWIEGAAADDAIIIGYSAEFFLSSVTEGGLGYGLRSDIGFVTVVPTEAGRVTAGLSVHDLGVSTWRGVERNFAAEGDQDTGTPERPASRTYFADGTGVTATAAVELDPARFAGNGPSALLIAADASLQHGLFAAHLGGEAGFGLDTGLFLVRAGAGVDNGFVFGVGGGLRLEKAGIDVALHSHRSPLTAHRAFGASVGLSFGY